LLTIANVNPEMLTWARKAQGLSQEEVSSKKRFRKVSMWEDGSKKPTMNQLLDLAHFYHRPSAIFFRSSPPSDMKKIRDSRSKSMVDESPLSSALITEFRLCENRRKRALELAEILDKVTFCNIPATTIDADVNQVGKELSRFLEIDFDSIRSFKEDSDVLGYWIDRVEARSILVFRTHTHTGLNPSYKEIRGVSSYEDEYPWILINSQEHPRGQLFTLGHELAHLMLRSSNLCDLNEDDHSDSVRYERFCNQVSAAALMPRKIIEEWIASHSMKFRSDEEIEKGISLIQKKTHTSEESIARRLVTLGFISWNDYNLVRDKSIHNLDEDRKKLGNIPAGEYYYKRVMRWNGRKYTNLTAEAFIEGKISLGRASELMSAKIPIFNKIISKLYQ